MTLPIVYPPRTVPTLAPVEQSQEMLDRLATWPTRFISKIAVDESCWIWAYVTNQNGYGRYQITRSQPAVMAHRYAYELAYGPIPKGRVLDHLCRNPSCVRPDHLDAVTQGENLRRGLPSNDSSGTCRRALHPWTAENILVDGSGHRRCRQCREGSEWAAHKRRHPGLAFGRRTHCPKGHAYDEANTITRRNGHRICRTCNNERQRNHRLNQRKAASDG